MNRKIIILLAFLIVVSGAFLVSSFSEETDKVSGEVYSVLEENNEVPVKINVEEGIIFSSKNKIKKKISKEKIIDETKDEIIINVNKKELEEIVKDEKVISVVFAPQFKAFLQDSVPLINASVVWAINLSNQNITGINETICIIDTGINFSHSDLVGKNKTCVIDCYNKNCVEDCSVHDDNGHGTHVAGIVAASSEINGVAINANLIGLKVLDENGNSHSTNGVDDIKNAIDWCVANRIAYNISVISMSLGTTNLYTNYCDSNFSSTLTKAINNATLYNVSVVSATGNTGSTTQISSPACIQNATAVGSIRKDDSTFDYNRNGLVDFIAPGYLINSTFAGGSCLASCTCSGNYMVCSGTSMATPHVAGAFALFRQFFRLQNSRVANNSEIESTFNSTAKQINDSGGSNLNYSRIDVYAAIDYLRRPRLTETFPSNNSYLNLANQNATFICNTSSTDNLVNITFSLWNSSSLVYNITENITSVTNQTTFLYNFSLEDNYLWNCVAYNINNLSNNDANLTITYDITNPQINLISPVNSSTWTSSSTVSFSYNVSDVSIANCSLIINNAIDQTDSSVTINQTTSFAKSLSNADYNWSVNCTDSANNINNSKQRQLTVSYTAPVVQNTGGGGGGGGGSSITTMTYIPSAIETYKGYTKALAKEDKIKFTLFDGGNTQHSLTLDYVGSNLINLTIRSNPIKLSLGVGQSAKLNLSSADYYDLYVKLESIKSSKANLTIQTISEKKSTLADITGDVVGAGAEDNQKDSEIKQPERKLRDIIIYALVLIFVIIGVIILLRKGSGKRKKESAKKEYKKKFDEIKPKKKGK